MTEFLQTVIIIHISSGHGGIYSVHVRVYSKICSTHTYTCTLSFTVRFDHQDGISSIDCLSRERPVTGGMSDRTVRLWKVLEESQLVFHGHK